MLIHNKSDSHAKFYRSTKEKKHLPAKLMHSGEIAAGYEKITDSSPSVILKGDYNDGIRRLVINGSTDGALTTLVCRSINLTNIPDCSFSLKNDFYKNLFPQNPKIELCSNTYYTLVFDIVDIVNETPKIPIGYAVGYGKAYYSADILWHENFPKSSNKVVRAFKADTIPDPPQYLMLRPLRSGSVDAVTASVSLKNIMVLKGAYTPETIPTKFMPYFPPTSVEISEPLYKIGNICDFIEVKSGKVLKHQLIGEDQNGRYVLPSPVITDLTETEMGDALLGISSEYGKEKVLEVSNGSLILEQYVQK